MTFLFTATLFFYNPNKNYNQGNFKIIFIIFVERAIGNDKILFANGEYIFKASI